MAGLITIEFREDAQRFFILLVLVILYAQALKVAFFLSIIFLAIN
jgi:hypothetical protein